LINTIPSRGAPPPGFAERLRDLENPDLPAPDSQDQSPDEPEPAQPESRKAGSKFQTARNPTWQEEMRRNLGNHKVRLTAADYELEFPALSVDVTDTQITVCRSAFLPMVFAPSAQTEFVLHLSDRSYPVVYLGGMFKIPEVQITGIAFFRKDQADDKKD